MRLVVLIPALNAPAELERTLASLAPDPVPFDIVVVDDGSSPALDVPDRAGAHVVVSMRLPVNRGVAHALNVGIGWALDHEYDFIARLDAGDLNEPERLALQVQHLADHPDVALVGSWTRHLDEQRQTLYVTRYPETWPDILRCFHYRTAFSHGACTMRTSTLRQVGAYDEQCVLGEDYDLFWRIAARFPCANLQRVLVTRVERRGSIAHVHRLATARIRLVLQWRHFAWHRADCWLGLARSIGLLLLPAPVVLSLKRAVGTIG